jgi:hypothetical protein
MRTVIAFIFLSSIAYAQVPVPTDVGVTGYSLEDTGVCYMTLAWDANTEADLKGYRIYESKTSGTYASWKIEIKCPPNDTSCCEYRLGPMPKGVYYWVATAFDADNNESAYSIELTHTFKSCVSKPKRLSVKE